MVLHSDVPSEAPDRSGTEPGQGAAEEEAWEQEIDFVTLGMFIIGMFAASVMVETISFPKHAMVVTLPPSIPPAPHQPLNVFPPRTRKTSL